MSAIPNRFLLGDLSPKMGWHADLSNMYTHISSTSHGYHVMCTNLGTFPTLIHVPY